MNTDPYVVRAGWARDELVNAGMGSQVRVITKAANALAGSDHEAYITYVQQKIQEHWRSESQPKPIKAQDIVLDVLEMFNEGYTQVETAQYLRRTYGLE